MTAQTFDPIRLEIYKHLFASIAEEMGVVLRKVAYSPNIKERRDFSCALFNAQGEMISQAAHIPVHLGSMPLSVAEALHHYSAPEYLGPGDMIALNDPYQGGTHLPDITLIAPVFLPDEEKIPFAYVANRAHHADVGGMMPGSMSVASEIFQEGLVIPPIKLVTGERVNQDVLDLILANVRTPQERMGDLYAQMSANQRGIYRLQDMTSRYGVTEVQAYGQALQDYTERMVRQLILSIPDGVYRYTDYLDDDGLGHEHIPIIVAIDIAGDTVTVDFSGSAPQQQGSVNAVYAITLSAVSYVFRSLVGLDVPNNSGCLRPIRIIAPAGTIVNAKRPAPVAGGNVETSQRIVDALFGALAGALPALVPAASQGTMNNVTIGGFDEERAVPFTYYETIGGGMGARPDSDGPSAIHSHMTNTLNTPIEALEYAYPLQVHRYEIRAGSGGAGFHSGGDGIQRDVQVLTSAQVSLLTERRQSQPYGLAGGRSGASGANVLIHDGVEYSLPAKGTIQLAAGDVLSIRTPGGGGWGSVNK